MADSRCSKCSASIFWRRSEVTRRAAPIDSQPTADGNIVLKGAEHYVVLPKGADPGDRPTYTNHFATCPQAGAFRR